MGDCGCEFSNVGHHDEKCTLGIPLIKRLELAKERAVRLSEFDIAAALRDAIFFVRKARTEVSPENDPCTEDQHRGTECQCCHAVDHCCSHHCCCFYRCKNCRHADQRHPKYGKCDFPECKCEAYDGRRRAPSVLGTNDVLEP